jgi:uncharacterized protein (TIGR02246 family)
MTADIPDSKSSALPARDSSMDVRAIRATIARWLELVRAKDIAAMLTLVTEDCVFLAGDAPALRGRDALEALYSKSLSLYDFDQRSDYEELRVAGDWAYGWGPDAITATPINGGDEIEYRGYGMTIFRRDADGVWRFARGINSMRPRGEEGRGG